MCILYLYIYTCAFLIFLAGLTHLFSFLFCPIMSLYVPCDLCLLAYSGVQHLLCCVLVLLVFVLLPVSLGCPFLIAPLVYSNVY